MQVQQHNHMEDSYASERIVQASALQPMLSNASLVWSLQVQRSHADKVLECSTAQQQQLRRRVRLDVQYAPANLSITLNRARAQVDEPITLYCDAEARPAQLAYAWYIDERPVEGANERELHIERVTRQLHARTLRCEVANEIGATSAVLTMQVHFAPYFVTHLLPPSLQPTSMTNFEPMRHKWLDAAAAGAVASRAPTSHKLDIGRQLAIGYEPGFDVELRCDFDANPRVARVDWFKLIENLQDEEYGVMQNKTPSDSDKYFEGAYTRAIWAPQAQPRDDAEQLDYNAMSDELHYELERLTTEPQAAQFVRKLEQSDWTTTNASLREPLVWRMIDEQINLVEDGLNNSSSNASTVSVRQRRVLHLMQAPQAEAQFQERAARVHSSVLRLNGRTDDAYGRYVCRAHMHEADAGLTRVHSFARSILVVRRASPRIISVRQQHASPEAPHVQLECLVQIHTVVDYPTHIRWLRNNRTIDELNTAQQQQQQQQQHDVNKFTTRLERSPDLLFLRSVLQIRAPTPSDFGEYVCSSSNENGNDSLAIKLVMSQPAGKCQSNCVRAQCHCARARV